MIVRRAAEGDLTRCIELGREFHNASPMVGLVDFNNEGFSRFYRSALTNDDIGMWLADIDDNVVGGCGAVVYPLYFNPDNRVAQEIWWWLTPAARGSGAGAQMFNQIKQWARDKNASLLSMVALENDRSAKIEKLYVRDGFTPMERNFMKRM